jgi:116 kDa U5 small nuclear ribonucleoprotein component
MDAAVLCVDVVDGFMMHTEVLIQQIIRDALPILLVLTKLDRLIRLPRMPTFKLLHAVESVNQLVSKISMGRYPELSPQYNNVAFRSAIRRWFFTLQRWTHNIHMCHTCEFRTFSEIHLET